MDGILIRQAMETDLPSIIRLQQAWADEKNTHGYVPDDPDQIQNRLGGYFLVAESDDRILGFIAGSVHVNNNVTVIPMGSPYLEIDDLYVIPSFRGQGVGSQLVDHLLSHTKERGLDYASLYSAAKDTHASLRFYERHQFQGWYVQMFRKL